MEPPDYSVFAQLLTRMALILTDSDGLQEEALSFNLPVLVARRSTERMEGLASFYIEKLSSHEIVVQRAGDCRTQVKGHGYGMGAFYISDYFPAGGFNRFNLSPARDKLISY